MFHWLDWLNWFISLREGKSSHLESAGGKMVRSMGCKWAYDIFG